MDLRIGIDFDNTIISYDRVFYDTALAKNWIYPRISPSKKSIRTHIRQTHGNDIWTQLQAIVYSQGVREATLMDGCSDFLHWLHVQKIPWFIISHKTKYAALGDKINLREPAVEWMKNQGLISPHHYNLRLGNEIFFEETKLDKLIRIKQCGITHFIDDLTELLLDKDFPIGVTKVHYNTSGDSVKNSDMISFSSWSDIFQYLKDLHEAKIKYGSIQS